MAMWIWGRYDSKMTRLLIANRGEIARRIDVAAQKLNLEVHFIYESGDTHHLRSDAPCHLVDDYLDQDAILEIIKRHQIMLVHPGYGYLSENGEFAKRVADQGAKWVGPEGNVIAQFGDKFATKKLAKALAIPSLQTAKCIEDLNDWHGPIMVKASMGGGGRALHIAQNLSECQDVIDRVKREALSIFKDDQFFFEPYLTSVRHIEVQILGDESGQIRILGDRDCSIQRRYQKIIEEAPARGLPQSIREAMYANAYTLAKHVNLTSCATVEFLFDQSSNQYWLMEVNPRIQVEHGVTELVHNIDLVGWQLKIAMGQNIDFDQTDISVKGHAIQARIYAEDPEQQFKSTFGDLWVSKIHPQKNVFWHTSIHAGQSVSQKYDPMIMKAIAYGETFVEARNALIRSLSQWHMAGVVTNRQWLMSALAAMQEEAYFDTQWAKDHRSELSMPIDLAYFAYAAAFLNYNHFNKAHRLDMIPGWGITGRGYVQGCYYIQDQAFNVRFQWCDHNSLLTEAGQKIIIHQDSDESLTIQSGEITHKIMFLAYKDAIWVMSYLGWTVTVSKQPFNTKSAHDSTQATDLMSPMPGVMVSCLVKPGDKVNKGDVLAIIEAMKMHHEIKATQNMKIRALNYQKGQHIPMGQPLFEWEAL